MLAFGVAALLGGCGNGGAPDPSLPGGFVERDSAGVLIAETDGNVARTGLDWGVAEEPALVIGGRDGEAPPYQFVSIGGVARVGDETMVVDQRALEVRYFDADGTFDRQVFGRRGQGPGDFEAMTLLSGMYSDSLLFFDSRNRRFTLLAPDGSGWRVFSEIGSRGIPGQMADRLAVVGRLVLERRAANPQEGLARMTDGGLYRMEWDLSLVDPIQGAEVDLGRVAGVELHYPGQRSAPSPPTAADLTPLGYPLTVDASVAVGRDRVFITGGREPEIREFDAEGVLRRLTRLREEPRFATPDELEELIGIQARSLGLSPAEARQRAERVWSEFRWPAFQRLLTDSEGHLWAQLPAFQGGRLTWIVFDPEGRALGTVQTPPERDLHIREIGRDFLLGVGRGPDDVPVVREFVLSRTLP